MTDPADSPGLGLPPQDADPASVALRRTAALQAVLANLPIGVAVFDAAHRLVLWNAMQWRLGGLNPESVAVGMTAAEVARLLAYAGGYGPGDPEEQAAGALRIDRRRPLRRQISTNAGRALELTSQPLADGGFVTTTHDVTDRLRQEEDALAQARLLESALRIQRVGIGLFDETERLRLHNAAFEQHLGLPPATLHAGQTLPEIMLRLQGENDFADPAEGHDFGARGETMRLRRDGTVLRSTTQPTPAGGFLLELEDVTALRRAEDEARRRAALFQAVLDALPHGVCIYGPDRRVAHINQAYHRIMAGAEIRLGESLAEIAARRVAAGEFAGRTVEEVLGEQLNFREEDWLQRRRVRPNGTVIAVRRSGLPDGGHIAVVTDITALHKAEQEARQRATEMAVMLENSRHGICLFDPEGRVVASNAIARQLTGLGDLLTPGASVAELRQLQFESGEFGAGEEALEQYALHASRGWPEAERYVRRRMDGTMVEVVTHATAEGLRVRSYTDVTEDRRIRQELEAAREAAEEANRAKSRFLATMSHELRTPLNAVIGFAEALRLDQGRERMLDYAGAIEQAGRGLLGMIDSILEVVRAETAPGSEDPPPIDIGAALRTCLREHAAAAAAGGLEIALRLEPDLPSCRVDARRFHQIISALVSNAVKFTPAGGSVTLSAARGAAGTLVVRVADTGIGIARGEIPRAFEPFSQLDGSLGRRYQGAGLGLYVARVLSGTLGCALSLESEPGQGTVATLSIPADRLTG
jgi:signal transduction histidine kinase